MESAAATVVLHRDPNDLMLCCLFFITQDCGGGGRQRANLKKQRRPHWTTREGMLKAVAHSALLLSVCLCWLHSALLL
jgi:hypothetical protein